MPNAMDKGRAAVIQSNEASKNGGGVEKGSWGAKAQSAGDRNANAGQSQGGSSGRGGQPQGASKPQ
ncbi:hypothetical protein CBS101457_003239 [Exobasidium rhododendri]|nr:hypothetical protein CBS101457_003239 [Exobasidium rhododendri]